MTNIEKIKELHRLGHNLKDAFRHVKYGENLPVLNREYAIRKRNQAEINKIWAESIDPLNGDTHIKLICAKCNTIAQTKNVTPIGSRTIFLLNESNMLYKKCAHKWEVL